MKRGREGDLVLGGLMRSFGGRVELVLEGLFGWGLVVEVVCSFDCGWGSFGRR